MSDDPPELVLRDLLDVAVAEDIAGLGSARPGERPAGVPSGTGCWVTVALADGSTLAWPAHDGAPLTATRHAGGPAWHLPVAGVPHAVAPDEVLRLLVPDADHVDAVAADLRTAVDHARVTAAGRARLPADAVTPGSGLLPGERLAATRDRPFHPTARAAAGWSAADLDRWGPTGGRPVTAAWVLVRRDHLRLGPGAGSSSLHRWLADVEHPEDFQPLPVHPSDHARVLPGAFADEIAAGVVVPLDARAGTLWPTASLRTLQIADTDVHLKLPLGVATLGATRLLPPRYLDNADRARRTLDAVLAADPTLAARVGLCDEGTWAGFARPDGADEFDERPGRLAAQIRTYPDLGPLAVPLAALAAHEWAVLGPLLGVDGPADARRFVADLARGVLGVAVGFVRHGVLPEMHGQNVVCCFSASGELERLVLRDHDTVRVHRPWLDVAEPGYRIAPGASQSLVLDTPADLVAYLQTLVVQVALRGVVDALGRYLGVDEPAWWPILGDALAEAVGDDAVLQAILVDADDWPARSVLRPLLERGPSGGVSMPAGTVRVPNPLRVAS